MATQKVNIDIKTKGAKKSKDQLGGLNNSITSLGRSALNAGAAYFGARGLINAIKFSTESFGIQEQAEKKLEVALGRTSQALLNQASALQKVTTFGDEAIIGVQSSLAAFLDSEEAIKKATEATLDISVAMGMDLKSAGDLVAKTLGSSTNAMSRYGITVEGAVGSTDRLESLTGNVAKLFGGQAKAQADTYAGAVQQLQNSLGDMAEDIGRIVVPIFQELQPHLQLAIDFWSEYLKVGDDNKKGQSTLSNEIKNLNVEIDKQTSLVDYISSTSYRTFDMMKIRASEASRTLAEQMLFENAEIERQSGLLNNLISTKEQQEKIEIGLAQSHENQLKIRKSSIATEIDFVKVVVPTGEKINKQKQKQIQLDLKSAVLQQTSAKDAMKAVIRAETMEAVAGYISSIFKSVPFPFNIGLAAGAGLAVGGVIDRNLAQFAEGGDFVTSGPQMIMVGDNPGGRERVQVTPLSSPNISGPQGININLNGNIFGTREFVRDTLIPEIQKAVRYS